MKCLITLSHRFFVQYITFYSVNEFSTRESYVKFSQLNVLVRYLDENCILDDFIVGNRLVGKCFFHRKGQGHALLTIDNSLATFTLQHHQWFATCTQSQRCPLNITFFSFLCLVLFFLPVFLGFLLHFLKLYTYIII